MSTTAIQQKKKTPVDLTAEGMYREMESRQISLAALLPPGQDVERFKEGFRFALAQTPALLKCTASSLLVSVMRAAKLGVDVAGGSLGHGYLVPYGTECQLVPGYKGLIALAVYAGVVQDMTPVLVHERDHFVPDEGTGSIIHHSFVPRRAEGNVQSRGEVIATYCRVLLPSGAVVIKGLLYLDDIERIAASVKAGNSPWKGPHRGEMIKKSSVRNAFKTLGVPEGERAERLREALRADAEAVLLDSQVEQPARGGAALKQRVLQADTTLGQRLEQTPEEAYAALEPTQEQVDAERAARGTT